MRTAAEAAATAATDLKAREGAVVEGEARGKSVGAELQARERAVQRADANITEKEEALAKARDDLGLRRAELVRAERALKLSSAQSARFEEDIRGIQQELFTILQVPRDDGVAPLEEITQAEQYPDGNPKKAEVFLKLFKLTIPGTQETYVERALALVGRVKKSTEAYLDDGQRELLNTIDLDWFGIKMQ